MAAPWAGKNGWAKFSNSDLANLQNWSLSITTDAPDATALGDDWAKILAGLQDFSVTAGGLAQKGFNPITNLGSSATLKLSFSGANEPYISGAAVLTGYTETASFDGVATCEFTFEGNSASGLTYSATGGDAASGQTNAYHGKQLKIDIAGSALTSPREWSINLACGTVETTAAHATNTYRTRLGGVKSATATITAVASGSPILNLGSAVNVKLYRTNTNSDGYFSGSAIITSVEHRVDVGEVELISYNLTFNGSVSYLTT